MTNPRLIVLTALAMIPLAANSWLCRAALRDTAIDAASFTSIRLISGALMLWLLVWLSGKARAGAGNWPSAFALFGYAALFSFAYLSLTAATGALLLVRCRAGDHDRTRTPGRRTSRRRSDRRCRACLRRDSSAC
jgi:hypothetical protein